MNKGVIAVGLFMWLGLDTLFILAGVFELGLIFGIVGIIVTLAGFAMKGKPKELPPPPQSFNNNQYPTPQMYNFQPNNNQTQPLGYPSNMAQSQNVQTTSQTSNEDVISQIERWGKLKEKGLITDQEFQRKKDELLK